MKTLFLFVGLLISLIISYIFTNYTFISKLEASTMNIISYTVQFRPIEIYPIALLGNNVIFNTRDKTCEINTGGKWTPINSGDVFYFNEPFQVKTSAVLSGGYCDFDIIKYGGK